MSKSAARTLLSHVGLAVHRVGRLGARGPALRILYYHSISDLPMRSAVSPPAFEGQMEHLVDKGYRVVPLADAVQRLVRGPALPPNAVSVTLDDGFVDNYEHAFPVLVRLELPATIFLTVDYIGTDRLPTLTRTDFVPRPLDWAQVREMQGRGVDFGSHTLTHPMLSRLGLEEARREISDSRSRLEDRLGNPVPLFCYPRGDFGPAVQRLVQEAGYVAACSTLPGVNGRRADLFALRRTYVSRQDTPGDFARRVAGAYDPLQRGLQLLRRLQRR